jgi:hypothetical protein
MSSFKDVPPVIAMPMQVKFKSETHTESMLFGIVPNGYDMDSIHLDYADDDKIFFYLTMSDYYGVLAGRIVLADEWEVVK